MIVSPSILTFAPSGISDMGPQESITARSATPALPQMKPRASTPALPKMKPRASTPALPKMKPPAQSGIKPSGIRPHKPRITSQTPELPDQNRPPTTTEGGVTKEKMVNEKGGMKGGGRVEGSKTEAKTRIKDPDVKAKPSLDTSGGDGGGGRDIIPPVNNLADTEPASPGSDGGGGERPCLI